MLILHNINLQRRQADQAEYAGLEFVKKEAKELLLTMSVTAQSLSNWGTDLGQFIFSELDNT